MTDDLDGLLFDLGYANCGWHRHVNPETGAAFLVPETAQSEDEWEARALMMHANQKPVTIEAKPVENAMARIVRGD